MVPIFNKQIKAGGPLTVTHRDVTRYFMTISEAASLVIQAGAMTMHSPKKGQAAPIYLLDMGAPIKIYDLAVKMIELSGLRPIHEDKVEDGDIKIQITGLKAGEKLHEELLIGSKDEVTSHPKIIRAIEKHISFAKFSAAMQKMEVIAKKEDFTAFNDYLVDLVEGFEHCKDNSD